MRNRLLFFIISHYFYIGIMSKELTEKHQKLKNLVKEFPREPGVYLMKDKLGEIIYVGKAKVLKNRVSSYFTGKKDTKTTFLVRQIHSIEHIVTHTEYEALLLENNLIKKHRPQYNISLKDDKSYPVIRVTKGDFPRVFKTRNVIKDGSDYYGPFANVRLADIYMELIENLFPLRKCAGPLKKRDAPCLYYHIGKCTAPCVRKVSKEEYGLQVRRVRNLLSGKTAGLLKEIQSEMKAASQELKFEKAAEHRDQIRAIEELQNKQNIIDFDPTQRDFVALAFEGGVAAFVVLQMRGGRIQGRDLYFQDYFGNEEDSLTQFLVQYYSTVPLPKGPVFLSRHIEIENLKKLFKEEGLGELDLKTPQGGSPYRLLRMAVENATLSLKTHLEGTEESGALKDLQRVLALPTLPERIEGFDIAQLDGNFPVASLICFKNGRPDRKNYRKFHMKSLDGAIDDYQSIREAVARRYTRLLNEEKDLPDLILVDGGKGQVTAAQGILEALGIKTPLCGLAKKNEEIFLPGNPTPIKLPEGSPALRVLQAVRDETHRFATNFNKSLRKKRLGLGVLEGVRGIGPKKSERLLKHFGSLEKMRQAEPYELVEYGGVTLEVAETLKTYLERREERNDEVERIKRSRGSL
jgi:excinuclease ABC subunit C